MKNKTLKTKALARAPYAGRVQLLRETCGGNECRVQFVLWADGVHLNIAGMLGSSDGEPVFRPAVCAWAAWKAAWAWKTPNV